MSHRFLILTTLLFLACSSGSTVVSKDTTSPDLPRIDQQGTLDSLLADSGTDLTTMDQTPEDTWVFDLGPDLPPLDCLPGEGCFLDKCTENNQCQSGWCVEHMGEGVCSQACVDECPQGWTCKQVGASDPDLVYVCVSDYSNLCKPCSTTDSCKAVGGAEDVCVNYGDEGAFCGGTCTANNDCPWGFSCSDAQTIDGIPTKQCLADAGSCPCTAKSVALSLWTPCASDNEAGSCSGKRVCTVDGLSQCDAPTPGVETCNGIDDDCDGFVDEPDDEGGTFVPLCDDANACTADTCNGADGCTHEPLTEGECMDGDPCTVADHCVAGECLGNPVICDDDNPCTDDTCDGGGGCTFTNNTADCDDDNPCTVADECAAGMCSGTAIPCDCQSDADCAALEDDDLCNGTLVCNLSDWPYKCVIDATTVVVCPQPAPGPDAICLQAHCEPDTGTCSLVPDHGGFACDDANPCTVGDVCDAGICTPGVPATCNDDNPCTDDSCDPQNGCVYTDNDAPCSDGNVCTTNDLCDGGLCLGGAPLQCDDANACNGSESCDAAVGCKAGTPLVCDDQDLCNGLESCLPDSGCQPGVAPDCDDNNPCTDDACQAALGCIHTSNTAACNDGNACTVGDVCGGGICSPGSAVACDDDNVCTTDTCDPKSGCIYLMNQAPCDDQDLCTTGDHCHLGECISTASLVCDDKNLCTDDSCQPGSGCQFVYNQAPCDDSNACTANDHCANGWCTGGDPVVCTDDNPCTDHFCDVDEGCKTVPNSALCDDGDKCTTGDLCVNAACTAGDPVTCDDFNLCTDDSCDPDTGCLFAANALPCDDGNACTANDSCADASCQPGPSVSCNDDNPCTTDGCEPDSGCTHVDLADQTECGQDKVCVAGECVSIVVHGNQTFSYTGSQQTFTVPQGVAEVTVVAYGAQGGNGQKGAGGKGGRIQANLAVTPGETLYVYVGGQGGNVSSPMGGFNGGGTGGPNGCGNYGGGGGGGASDVRVGGAALNNRVVVAGGAGGGGEDGANGNALYGGAGGGTVGQKGQDSANFGCGSKASGQGGTQSAGGAAGVWACSACNAVVGALGQGGNGNTSSSCGGCTGGGGGGGGYYGGGGGGHGGGGGGSSYAGPGTSNVTHEQGIRNGNGEVRLEW
jgi:hypothetical protein